MKNTLQAKLIYRFYHSAVKAELKRRGFSKNTVKKIEKEHKLIVERAKDIGKSNLLSSYIMGSYFIALNRSTGRSAEENYEIFRDGLCASKLFHKITGNADSPLARESDICLCTGHPDEVCALGMTPTTSTTVMTVIGDILVVETMKRTGFTIEEYSKRHHGGYLGERSRELSK